MLVKCFDESHNLVCIVGLYWPAPLSTPPLLSKTENRALYKQCADQSWNVQSSSKHLESQKTLNQKEQIFKGFSSIETLLVGILSDIFQSGSNLYSCQVNSRLWNTFLLPHCFLLPKLCLQISLNVLLLLSSLLRQGFAQVQQAGVETKTCDDE